MREFCTSELAYAVHKFDYRDNVLYHKNTGIRVGYDNGKGYLRTSLQGKNVLVHRLIWYMHYGFTDSFIDHMDGNKQNNSLDNLRLCTKSENACNSATHKDSSSSVKGVSWNTQKQRWRAVLFLNGVQYHVGFFKDIPAAESAVHEARFELHGEFARQK